mmetsp:Transcript_9038/g.26832  ORF Transcript_9038/g.26832 Transcript_9038/m.26832 type:complete len:205 (-) Transcript_9038:436-1050(-)
MAPTRSRLPHDALPSRGEAGASAALELSVRVVWLDDYYGIVRADDCDSGHYVGAQAKGRRLRQTSGRDAYLAVLCVALQERTRRRGAADAERSDLVIIRDPSVIPARAARREVCGGVALTDIKVPIQPLSAKREGTGKRWRRWRRQSGPRRGKRRPVRWRRGKWRRWGRETWVRWRHGRTRLVRLVIRAPGSLAAFFVCILATL